MVFLRISHYQLGGVVGPGNAKPDAMTVQGDNSRLLTLALLSPTSHQVNLYQSTRQ